VQFPCSDDKTKQRDGGANQDRVLLDSGEESAATSAPGVRVAAAMSTETRHLI
jgi:hypothetical protein